MLRPIAVFDYDKCTGCGDCEFFCAKGIIEMVDGKPRHVEDRYCDGIGICVPQCQYGAIHMEEREVEPFDMREVRKYWAEVRRNIRPAGIKHDRHH